MTLSQGPVDTASSSRQTGRYHRAQWIQRRLADRLGVITGPSGYSVV